MLRLHKPEEGVVLREAIFKLDTSILNRIVAQLDVQQQDQPGRTPTYIPAVLANLSNSPQLVGSKQERLSKAIILGLPFITKVLEKHKKLIINDQIDPNIPLNFNIIAGIAKAFPDRLNNEEFYIDKEGNVRLVSD